MVETRAIKQVFGAHAYRIPVSSTKSQVGHCLGAAGAIEALAALLALRDGFVPPTATLDEPDPECDLDYVPRISRPADAAHRALQLVRLRRQQHEPGAARSDAP